ncbi:hypothetical protein PR202_ga21309 [Eleusine coracana subsp. coracana]|uniref:Uncharacterized protein n=1 Tax=Eleusine coracana subsp. coracana TaxID=191504 RepID=A0AAV5D0P6_ELECO|nr:hypothetical protein PR202_ga21309 [Eleusine coracana subsp. coracana]
MVHHRPGSYPLRMDLIWAIQIRSDGIGSSDETAAAEDEEGGGTIDCLARIGRLGAAKHGSRCLLYGEREGSEARLAGGSRGGEEGVEAVVVDGEASGSFGDDD